MYVFVCMHYIVLTQLTFMAAFWTLYDLSCKRHYNHIMPSKNKQEIKVSREMIAKSVHFFLKGSAYHNQSTQLQKKINFL